MRRIHPLFLSLLHCLLFQSVPPVVMGQTERFHRVEVESFPVWPAVRLANGFRLGSDSVYRHHLLLERSRAYAIDSTATMLTFDSTLAPADSLRLVYWILTDHYLQSARASLLTAVPDVPLITRNQPADTVETSPLRPGAGSEATEFGMSDLTIQGTKRVTLAGGSAGQNKLSQQLELSVRGQLSKGLTVRGHLSDQGRSLPTGQYDAPTASDNVARLNSALSRLDRVQLQLEAPAFQFSVGDLDAPSEQPRFWFGGTNIPTGIPALHDLTGVQGSWHSPGGTLGALLGRPRGERITRSFRGRDNLQGPYRITDQPGGSALVPGSETVWLDGVPLSRGASADYLIDYTVGTITFNNSRQIDQRSRIELTVEVTSDTYRREVMSAGASVPLLDSAAQLLVQFQRQQDNSDGPLADSALFSVSDFAGNESGELVRSGIIADSSGDYQLIADSLPDSVLVFVGNGKGNYTLRATFVGPGGGTYRYLGNGRYQFVGSGKGDYLPILRLRAPQRKDQTLIAGLFSPRPGMHSALEWRGSFDKLNRLAAGAASQRNGDAWAGMISTDTSYSATYQLNAAVRYQEAAWTATERFMPPDLARRFLIPDDSIASGDRYLATTGLAINPAPSLRVSGSYAKYARRGEWNSGESSAQIALGRVTSLSAAAGFRSVSAARNRSADFGRASEGSGSVSGVLGRVLSGNLSLRIASRTGRVSQAGYDVSEREGSWQSRWWELVTTTISADRTDSTQAQNFTRRESQRGAISYTIHHLGISSDGSLSWQRIREQGVGHESAGIHFRADGDELPAGLRWSLEYRLGDELSTSRGVTFLRVPGGEGNYRKVDSSYLPDPNGDFIRVEEILSDSAVISRGEKNAALTWSAKPLSLSASTSVFERRYRQGSRALDWLLPWVSPATDSFQSQATTAALRAELLGSESFRPLTAAWESSREVQQHIDGADIRREWRWSVSARQRLQTVVVEGLFQRFGKNQSGGYGLSGDISGYRAQLSGRGYGEVWAPSAGIEFRRAREQAGEELTQWRLTTGLRMASQQESKTYWNVSGSVEGYANSGTLAARANLLLSENRRGRYGAVISLSGSARGASGLSARISFSETASEGYVPIISGRTELAVSF